MESLNDIYKNDQLFYWSNAIGEINMPGDGNDVHIHTPDELPSKCREIFDRYFKEDGECKRYVVSLKGHIGLLLVALHDEYEVSENCGLYPDDKNAGEEAKVKMAMAMYAYILKRRVACMEKDAVFNGCTLLFGDYTDPIGHELALFVPESELKRLFELEDCFLQGCWFAQDNKKLAKSTESLFTSED